MNKINDCFDHEALKETLEILSDSKIMKSLAKSAEDIRKRRVYNIDEV